MLSLINCVLFKLTITESYKNRTKNIDFIFKLLIKMSVSYL